MSSAGRSAAQGYRSELAHRRRAALRSASCLLAAAGLVWLAVHVRGDPRLAAGSGAALLAGVFYMVRPEPDPERWLRGAEGEVATARILERLPARRWVVLHDLAVPGGRANIDHLAIGPTGVWVIDTKTTRGRARRGLTGLKLGGRRLDTGPVAFEAQVVADRLGVDTRPVVAVHGAGGLRRRGVRCGGIRVVPAGALLRRLRGRRWWPRRAALSGDDVQAVARLAQARFAPAGFATPGCTGRNGGGTGRSATRVNRSGG